MRVDTRSFHPGDIVRVFEGRNIHLYRDKHYNAYATPYTSILVAPKSLGIIIAVSYDDSPSSYSGRWVYIMLTSGVLGWTYDTFSLEQL